MNEVTKIKLGLLQHLSDEGECATCPYCFYDDCDDRLRRDVSNYLAKLETENVALRKILFDRGISYDI